MINFQSIRKTLKDFLLCVGIVWTGGRLIPTIFSEYIPAFIIQDEIIFIASIIMLIIAKTINADYFSKL